MLLPDILRQWSVDPSVVCAIVLAVALYARGATRSLRVVGGTTWHGRSLKAMSFVAGLAVIVIALESPIDYLSSSLFTFHMIQHVLLIMVAPPLLLLGDPGVTMMRGIPLGLRRALLRAGSRRSWVCWLVATLSRIVSPRGAFIVFCADLYLWHWSLLFNLTLRNNTVHVLEHTCFLLTALLWWSQVIDQRALHASLSYARRAVFAVVTAGVSNVLALYFVFAPHPVYSAYARLSSRPYGMTVLSDQQIAGAVMWVPVLFLFGGVFAVCLYKALAEDEREVHSGPVAGTPYSMSFLSTDAGNGTVAHR